MCKNGKCNAVRHAFERGRVARIKGQSMSSDGYHGMPALQGAFQNGWLEEDIRLSVMEDQTEDELPMTEVNVQQMRDNLDWAKEYA